MKIQVIMCRSGIDGDITYHDAVYADTYECKVKSALKSLRDAATDGDDYYVVDVEVD